VFKIDKKNEYQKLKKYKEDLKGSLELKWINKDKSLLYEYDEEGNIIQQKRYEDGEVVEKIK